MVDSSIDRLPLGDVVFDGLVLSDLHLGSDVCQAKLLEEFLEWAVDHSRELIINGDIFDDLNFRRLSKRHFACLKVIRRNSDRDDLRVVWLRGNHDGAADIVSHIVGVEIRDEYVFENGQIRLLVLHGDQFDAIVTRYKILTDLASRFYSVFQKGMPHRASRWLRRISKHFQRNSEVVQRRAVEYARSKSFEYLTCGHTHHPLDVTVDGVRYLNSGTWTEAPPCPFVAIRGSDIRLMSWPLPQAERPTAPIEAAETSADPD